MQINQASKEELGLLIYGLRAIYIADHAELRDRLLEQLECKYRDQFGRRFGIGKRNGRRISVYI